MSVRQWLQKNQVFDKDLLHIFTIDYGISNMDKELGNLTAKQWKAIKDKVLRERAAELKDNQQKLRLTKKLNKITKLWKKQRLLRNNRRSNTVLSANRFLLPLLQENIDCKSDYGINISGNRKKKKIRPQSAIKSYKNDARSVKSYKSSKSSKSLLLKVRNSRKKMRSKSTANSNMNIKIASVAVDDGNKNELQKELDHWQENYDTLEGDLVEVKNMLYQKEQELANVTEEYKNYTILQEQKEIEKKKDVQDIELEVKKLENECKKKEEENDELNEILKKYKNGDQSNDDGQEMKNIKELFVKEKHSLNEEIEELEVDLHSKSEECRKLLDENERLVHTQVYFTYNVNV